MTNEKGFNILLSDTEKYVEKSDNEKKYAGKDFYVKSGILKLTQNQVEYNRNIFCHLQKESDQRSILLSN